ncbi:FtsK/SpoIIIE domain-containing protein [Microbacterium ginsengisoli]|nr:hypothetical protein [Microbacteriaceae bacterium K1510]
MAQVRSAAPTGNLAPFVTVIAVVGAVAAAWFRLPALVVLAAGLTFAAWMSVPPAPPVRGAGAPVDERAVTRHRIWADLRWSLLVPSSGWLFNDPADWKRSQQQLTARGASSWSVTAAFLRWFLLPTAFTSVIALGVAAVTFTLPVDALDAWGVLPGSGIWLPWVNAAAGYVVVAQVAAVRRRHAAPQDPQPPLTLWTLASTSAARGTSPVGPLIGAVALAAVVFTSVVVAVTAAGFDWLISPLPVTAAGAALIVAAAVLRARSLPEGLDEWRELVRAREQWAARWVLLKQDPAPVLLARRSLASGAASPVTVDTFEAPATLGAAGLIALQTKITPTVGAGTRVTVLSEPDIDSSGQPILSSRHPLRASIVSWPLDATVDFGAIGADDDLLRIALRTAAARAAETFGHPQPLLQTFTPIFEPDAPDTEPGDDTDSVTPRAAYSSTWVSAEAGDALMGMIAGSLPGLIGAEAICDTPAGVVYVGDLTSGAARFVDEDLAARFDVLAREAAWAQRWRDVLKMGEQQPYIQTSVYRKYELPSGQVIESQPFMTAQAVEPEQYMTAEKERKLQSTLNNVPFVAVTPWKGADDRAGGRHSGAFRVLWSADPIPRNPARIRPGRGVAQSEATQWALAAAVNAAFDGAHLPRGEVLSAICLTSPASTGHIWDIRVRLYGGVTLLAVKAAAEKIRQGLGAAEWLRVTADAEGCRIVAGANPTSPNVTFERPRNRELTVALDWEAAFAAAKILGANGDAPQLQSSRELPKNAKVLELLFQLPAGTSRAQIRESRQKLMTATGNLFLMDRDGDTAAEVQLLVSQMDPLPFPAPMDWEVIESSKAIPFGSSVDGAPVEFDWTIDPHLLVLGGTGSGKSQYLNNIIIGSILRGCELWIIDPMKFAADFRWSAPWAKAIAITEEEASAVMDVVSAEVDRRRELNGQYGVSSYLQLPPEVRPPHIVVLIDEFTELIIGADRPKPLPERASEAEQLIHAEALRQIDARRNVGARAGRFVRLARSTGVTLVLAAQDLKKDTIDQIPGGGSLKNNMSVVLLGRASNGSRLSALKNPTDTPDLGDEVPKGRGVFESTSSRGNVFQAWFDAPGHVESLVSRAAAARAPLADDERVSAADLIPDAGAAPVHGRRISADDGSDDGDAADEVIDIGTVDLGIDFDALPAPGAEDDTPLPARAVTIVGPGVSAEEPGDVDLDDLPPGPERVGVPAIDAILQWVAEHPDVTHLTWASPMTGEVDEIGILYAELARAAIARTTVTDFSVLAPAAHVESVSAVEVMPLETDVFAVPPVAAPIVLDDVFASQPRREIAHDELFD